MPNNHNDAPAKQVDLAANDLPGEDSRDGAKKRRDPNEPSAVVGIGASAGGIAPLQQFFEEMKADTGLAFVVVMHLSPDFESQLAEVIQQKTKMPVVQVTEAVKVQADHVYVIPPNHQLTFEDSMLRLLPPQQAMGRRVTIDLFFRTLAHAYGQRAVSIIMSGTDSDGMIGLKHIRAQGGVTMAQEPEEAEFDSMPLSAINTGMVDWVLRVEDMPRRLLEFVRNENAMQLPPEIPEANEPDAKVEEAPGGETVSDETRDPDDEEALLLVLKHVRARTGQDFDHYKRATVLRRIARRMQVTSVESIPRYLDFLAEHEGEARALLHDLLIGVTHFFRDQTSFAALEANIPQLFAGKKHVDEVRVWVTGCATGEEAYSIAMLLCEHAEKLSEPPSLQIFATDLDEQSIQEAREGVYPTTIEADVTPERLRGFFVRDNGRYRVKKHIRDKVLFARHNVLSDPAFSRVDLVTCRNLLIYLNREAQARVFDVFHFALRAGGLLFIGGAESADGSHSLFSPLDIHHRIYVRRSLPRPAWRIPTLPTRVAAPDRRHAEISRPMLPGMTSDAIEDAGEHSQTSTYDGQQRRSVMFGELHLKLLEEYGPPSVVVNEAYDIVHLSENAGRYLAFRAGEPSTNLMTVVNPALRVELRTALFRAGQSKETVIIPAQRVPAGGDTETMDLHVRPIRPGDSAHGFFLILFEKKIEALTKAEQATERATISRQVGDQLQSLKEQLNATVEQFEVSSEELKASNEELQAMNEELRSAAEELETSKEELQSVNEELITVNQELKEKVEELSHANSDLNNLMTSTDLATMFLDRQLRVVRFTPRVQDLFNLLPADVGRPISDITHKLRYDTLVVDAERVLERLASIEREIETEDSRCLLSRIAPYRTLDDKISGVVVTLIDVTQIKRAQAEVRAGTERYRTLFELVPVAVYTTDAEGVIQDFNDHAVELWGRKPQANEKFCGSFKIFHPDGRPLPHDQCPMARVLHAEKLEPEELDILVEQEDGKRRNVIVAPRAIKNADGKIVGAINCLHDISSRKQIEQALRESEARFRTVADNVPQLIWTNDGEGTANYFNRRWFDYSGLSYDASYGLGWEAIVHPEDGPASVKRWKGALAKGEVFDAEYRLRGADKEYRWFIGRNVPLRANGHVVSWFGTATDIDDLKKAEAALRASEARFRAMFEQASVGIVQLDDEARILAANPGFCAIVGYSEEELRRMRMPDVSDPDDWKEEEKLAKRIRKGEIGDYALEKRYWSKDGGVVWGAVTATLVRDDEGEPLYTLKVVQAITERKEAQEQLRRSEERYRLLVDGASDYAIFMVNPSNEIVYWSAGAERVFGWRAEEAVGKSGELIFTPEDRAMEQEEKEIGIALEKGVAPDKRWHLRKDGTRIWVDGVMRRLDDEKTGSLRGFAKVARDATEQRRAEEELRQAHEELEQRVKERTRELRAKNRLLEMEVKRRRALENEILRITESERARIGQDLHDSLCQELTATAFLLKSRAKGIAPQSRAASDSLTEAAETVNKNVGLARDLARGLHPFELGSAGLPSALRELCSRLNESVDCRCNCPRSLRVEQNVALNLYRIAQEGVTNSVKHAKASEVVISLERTNGEIVLTVSDDGQGIKRRGRGLGTHIMEYRARAAGGTLGVESKPGRGTTVTCRVPAKS